MTYNDLVRKGNLVKVQQKMEERQEKFIQYSDDDKVTPLHVAAIWGYLDIVKFLVEKGFDINAKDAWNKTPLYRAVAKDHFEIAKFLIAKGADKSVKDVYGKTVLDIAKENKSQNMVELLEGGKK